jgi:hypothetical protein
MADLPIAGVAAPQGSPAPVAPSNVIGAPGAAPIAAAAPAPAKPAVSGTPAPAAPAGGMVPLAALQEERERRQSLQADLESLKQQVGRLQQPQTYQQPVQQQQQPQVDHTAELNRLWETDPRKAVQVEIMMAAQWTDNINAQVDQESDALANKYKDFNNFRGEAMRYVRSLPLEQRARPGIVEMAYMLARGQGVDQLIEQQRVQLQQQFQQNPAMFQMPVGAGGNPPPTQQPVGLTEEQLKVAAAMRMTPEQYSAGIRR